MVKQLDTPILEGGLHNVNFFNGRLLSAEDLSQEQAANRESRQRLGQAMGDGIVFGLEVEKKTDTGAAAASVVTLKKGLAINRLGQTLALAADADVSLVRPIKTNGSAATTTPILFADCQPVQRGVYVAGTGVYLLTMAPAEGTLERAPYSGLGNVAAACGARYLVEGVQFRLVPLAVTPAELSDENRLRNRVAYKCFGVEALTTPLRDPFGPPVERYGLLDDLRPNALSDCEVPLAVIHWTARDGIKFVDLWSARRHLTPSPLAGRWNPVIGQRRAAEAEAMFLQFEAQIEGIRANERNLESIVATARFDYLPPIGILPIGGVRSSRGFDYQTFFQGKTYRDPVYVEGARVEALIHEALRYPPIKLSSGEMFWLYFVRENKQTIDNTTSNPPQAYLMFVNGHVPYRGEARFDLNYWNYSNFA